MSSFGNSLVQAIDILEGDVRYLQMLERWADMIVEHAPVICGGAGTLPHQVLGLETLDQIGHGRRRPFGRDVGQRIAALVDQPTQPLRLSTGRRGRPVWISANRMPSFTGGASAIVQDEGTATGSGDATTEAGHVAVVGNAIAGLRPRQPLDDGVGETLAFDVAHCSRVRTISVPLTACRVQLM